MAKKFTSATAGIIDYGTTYAYFLQRLRAIAVSCFEYENLPLSVSQRFMELSLIRKGHALYFHDDVLDADLCMRAVLSGPLDVYDIPMTRRAYANNGYTAELHTDDSVIIYDNYLHEPVWPQLCMFAQRLANIEQTKDINLKAQKTPVLILCDEKQRLTFENLYLKYDSGAPVIFGSKNLDISGISVMKTDAPYLLDKLQEEKINVLHEAFSFLGVGSMEIVKRERYLTNEIEASQEGNIAQRANRLKARVEAVNMINAMFNQNISVKYSPLADQLALELERATIARSSAGGAEITAREEEDL